MDKKFLEEHFGFILTISITYVFSALFVVFQFLSLDGGNLEQFLDILLNSMVPTTITYVFGCVLVNIVELIKDKADGYVFNVITIFMVFIYAMVFTLYWQTGFMWRWFVGELIATAFILYLNILCYREKYRNRSHALV